MRGGTFAVVLALAVPVGCFGLGGGITPVPPVHRVPADASGRVVLIDRDPGIETKDPGHIERATAQRVPQGFRAAMEKSLALAGFVVTANPNDRHDLHATLAIAVTEEGEHVRQVYRCGLAGADGAPVAQIDWTWPRGVYVDPLEVFDFATHNLATDVATSPRVIGHLRGRGPVDGGADGGG